MSGEIPIEKKFHMLSQIQRISHFEWLEAAMHFAKEGTTELDLVKKFWEIVGRDTSGSYLKHLNPEAPLPRQIAESFVFSSRSMGEDAVLVEGADENECFARHNGCPWHEWHERLGKLDQDLPGCDAWLESFMEIINETLGTNVRWATVKSLPAGDDICLRRFWVD
ncbi:MAG: hypothetical protein ABIK09_03890 [Pseudomonadota bacterium]